MSTVFVITFADIIGMIFAGIVALIFFVLFVDSWIRQIKNKRKK